jgi:hypothetical protein
MSTCGSCQVTFGTCEKFVVRLRDRVRRRGSAELEWHSWSDARLRWPGRSPRRTERELPYPFARCRDDCRTDRSTRRRYINLKRFRPGRWLGSCKLWPSPGIYALTSFWLVKRTRATLRIAELGFFGVVVYTRVHTPLRWGHESSAGDFDLVVNFFLPFLTSCWMVGIYVIN